MAVLWQREVLGRKYEVREAGRSRRLYTDGVFHSQFNPVNPVTGSIWDLLLLPAFFYHKNKVKRILVLGVGGGAVIRQFQYFLNPDLIVGVELNPNHLFVAKRYFGVKGKNVSLFEADAMKWVKDYKGEPFDLIIDDLFGEQDGEPVRAIEFDSAWVNKLSRLLVSDGVLVSNFVSSKELKNSACFTNKNLYNSFNSIFRLGSPKYDNAIGVFLKINTTSQVLKKNLMLIPKLNPTLKTSRLHYRIKRL